MLKIKEELWQDETMIYLYCLNNEEYFRVYKNEENCYYLSDIVISELLDNFFLNTDQNIDLNCPVYSIKDLVDIYELSFGIKLEIKEYISSSINIDLVFGSFTGIILREFIFGRKEIRYRVEQTGENYQLLGVVNSLNEGKELLSIYLNDILEKSFEIK